MPVGAVSPEPWQPEGIRVFDGEERRIEEIKVWTHGVQHVDGHIDDGAIEPPLISVDGVTWEEGISGETARRLPDLLVMAADEVDEWSGGIDSQP